MTPETRLTDEAALKGVHTLEAGRAFFDDFNGGRHGALCESRQRSGFSNGRPIQKVGGASSGSVSQTGRMLV